MSFNIPPINRKEDIVVAKTPTVQTLPEYEKLADEIHHLKMVLESVWNLLKEKTGLSDEDLKQELKEIKFKNAEAAAKSEPGTCSNCGKTIAQDSTKCVFCGRVQEKEKGLF